MHWLGEDWVELFRDRLRAVTPRQVKAVSAQYLFPQPPAIVVLGKASEVRKQLKGLGTLSVVPVSEFE